MIRTKSLINISLDWVQEEGKPPQPDEKSFEIFWSSEMDEENVMKLLKNIVSNFESRK